MKKTKIAVGCVAAQAFIACGSGNVALSAARRFIAEGRCDAVLFSSDPQFTPPNEDPAMAACLLAAIVGIAVIAGGLYWMYRQMGVSTTTTQDPTPVFEEARAPFKGQQPYIEMSFDNSEERAVVHVRAAHRASLVVALIVRPSGPGSKRRVVESR